MSKTEPCSECHLDGLNGCDICGWERSVEISKRPSSESLWQAFWATPHDEREWNRPTGTDGKPMPMTLVSFKYEVVRAAFELDAKRATQQPASGDAALGAAFRKLFATSKNGRVNGYDVVEHADATTPAIAAHGGSGEGVACWRAVSPHGATYWQDGTPNANDLGLNAGSTIEYAYTRPPASASDAEVEAVDRDAGGRIVRQAWVEWALEQPNRKPSWLVPYDELSEPDKEVDRRIYEACAQTSFTNAIDLRAALDKAYMAGVNAPPRDRAAIAALTRSPARVGGETKDARDYEALYFDLIYQVGNKYAGESRHETAKRYLQRAEQSDDSQSAKQASP